MSEFNNTSFSEPVGMNNTILTDQGVALVLIEPYLHRLYPGSTGGDLPSRLVICQPLGACLVGRGHVNLMMPVDSSAFVYFLSFLKAHI